MTISTGGLALAGATASKNVYFSGLMSEVKAYNAISKTNKQTKADALVRVMQIAGWYLTSKPPQPKSKNKRRWKACLDLATDAGSEADQLEIRMLTGPANFKTIDQHHQSYWLEYLDPQHRPGYQLSPQWQGWLTDATAIANKTSFWDHIGTVLNPTDLQVLVKYYPESSVYSNLDSLLHFDGYRLLDKDDDPFHTQLNTTHFSRNGWAIFVVSPENKFFSGSHAVGQHHHSSFLGGGAVIAAGEIVVDDGWLRVITAKSGHYRPSPENLRSFIQKQPGVNNAVAIRPDLADRQKHGEVRFYTCGDYRANGAGATRLTQGQLLQKLPPFARTPAFKSSTFDHVPVA